ncbi:DUF1905 domain-containing protein [Hymenobacter oligotrophus]|uniref:DUF1905 domain-containing protein n=1 Tax=Hymenobacter oligotrophus TaxID=2319843 RepID=A0A3B7R4G9_9BACT|nr:YdeI/OmpD-associated family protein [Hymenobacter oligotrophus]AYA36451.1 DUF1905 domain-containing protein [Hymenobacter oligotrophus]
MILYSGIAPLAQLDKRKGGYYYLHLPAELVAQFPQQGRTRLVCTLDGRVSYSCGLNHFGDGSFFVIVAGKHLKTLGKQLGDEINAALSLDEDPLGVEVPEVLAALLAQDEALHARFVALTVGKQRSIVHAVARLKDLDKQLALATQLVHEAARPRPRRAG